FLQVEGGIRDWSVTGVQTCALPISPPPGASYAPGRRRPPRTGQTIRSERRLSQRADTERLRRQGPGEPTARRRRGAIAARTTGRSEERRVGKEGRQRSERRREQEAR